MKIKFKEQLFEKEKQYLVLHENGRIYRVLKVTEDDEKNSTRFYLFGGQEIDHPSEKIAMREESNFVKFFIEAGY